MSQDVVLTEDLKLESLVRDFLDDTCTCSFVVDLVSVMTGSVILILEPAKNTILSVVKGSCVSPKVTKFSPEISTRGIVCW